MAEKWSDRLLRTRTQVQTLISGSGLNYPGFFQISNAVGSTKQILVWSKSVSTINQLALNLTDDTIGIYDITADTFTTSFLTKANNLSDVADEATSLYNIAKIKSGKFSLNTSQLFNLYTAPYSLASVFPAVAGHFWVILSCQIKYTLNTTPFDIRINIGASTAIDGGGTILFNMNGYISDTFGAGAVIQAIQNDYVVNDYLHIGTQDVATTGDGSAIFYITAMLVEA